MSSNIPNPPKAETPKQSPFEIDPLAAVRDLPNISPQTIETAEKIYEAFGDVEPQDSEKNFKVEIQKADVDEIDWAAIQCVTIATIRMYIQSNNLEEIPEYDSSQGKPELNDEIALGVVDRLKGLGISIEFVEPEK